VKHGTSHQKGSRQLAIRRARTLLGRFFFLAFVAAVSFQAPLRAQNLCNVPAPTLPCLDQPQADDTQITGRAKKGKVDIVINGAVLYTNVKTINHKFAVKNIPALGAGGLVNVIYEKVAFPAPVVVLGNGVCQENSVDACLEVPIDREVSVSGKNGAVGFKIVVNPANPAPQTFAVNVVGAGGAFKVPVSKLSQYDQVDLRDITGKVVAGPVMVRVSNSTTQCTAKSKLPCLSPVKEGDPAIKGFATPGAVIAIDVAGADKGNPHISADGSFSADASSLKQGQHITATQTGPAGTASAAVAAAATPADSGGTSSLYTLGLIGLNATGSTMAGPSQQYFAEIDLIAPVKWFPGKLCSDDEENPLARRCWLWLNPRVASVPASTSSALSSLSSTSLTTGIGSQTVSQIVQSFEFQAGFEYYLLRAARSPYWGFGTTWGQSAVSIILGGGTVTPFSSTTAAPEFGLNSNLAQQFSQNPQLESLYPQLAGGLCSYGLTSSPPTFTCPSTPSTKPTSVAFLVPNRSRFYRDFYGGLRLRFFYSTGDCDPSSKTPSCKSSNVFPGTVDLRLGQDETITGGKLRGVDLTVSGSFPIPGTQGTVRLFGSTYLRLHKNVNTTALVLIPTSPVLSLDNAALVVQQTGRSDQDYYRLGIGVDLFPILSKLKSAATQSASKNSSSAQ
jgi:hypothetical protein